MLMALTSVASASIASRSALSNLTRRPARSPPACSLVCPGHATTALFPNASNAWHRIARKPEPYARRTVTATMPHTMPSIVRKLRVRLRARLVQLWTTSSRSMAYPPASQRSASIGSIDAARRAG